MANYTLGLDIGSNSIGWALIETKPKPSIIATGVRVFPEGVDRDKQGGEVSKCQARRMARGARRNRSRKAYRKDKLVRTLRAKCFLPKTTEEIEQLFLKDPYALRAKGLDEKLERFEFGRALYHLNQRRGFWSNRKSGKAKEDGVVKKQATELQAKIDAAGCRTLGEYFSKVNPHEERIRGHYTFRAMYENEFDLLWQKQAEYYPELKDEEYYKKIRYQTIFYQRPLKPTDELIGKCKLETAEQRCPRGDFYARRFRILQDVNNLLIYNPDGIESRPTDEQRNIVFAMLSEKKDVSFDDIRKKLGLMETQTFNLEEGKADKKKATMKGDEFAASLRKILGKKEYARLSEADIALLNEYVLDDSLSDEQVVKELAEKFGFAKEQAEKIKDISLPERYMSYSRLAIQKLLPHLEKGLTVDKAIQNVYGRYQASQKKELQETLPMPENLRNPIVNRGLSEVRKVVNAIIREYGRPDAIKIEMAREIKGNKEQRRNIQFEQEENRKDNERIKQRLINDLNITKPKRDDVIKYRLWEECGKECVYTGKTISQEKLFGSQPEFQIEHILPYSRSLDDSFMNKTLCYVGENIRKNNQTPYEAYNGDPELYEQILKRAAKLPWRKRRRFVQKELVLDECIERQLKDTQYITTEVVEYLKNITISVIGTKGQSTAELRHQWGLNNILDLTGTGLKKRDDHRHHAVDAIVTALTTPEHLRKLARSKYNPTNEIFKEPWEEFRKEAEDKINKILVSHRVSRKVSGALHEETNYGPTGLKDEKGQDIYVYRKKLQDLTGSMVNGIVDDVVRGIVKARLSEFGKNSEKGSKKFEKEVWNEPLYMKAKNDKKGPQIKSVRIRDVFNNMIELKDKKVKTGKPYRAVSSGSNHHIEIFEYKDGKGNIKRDGRVISRYDAVQRLRRKEPVVYRDYGDGRKFLFSLSINEMFMLEDETGGKLLHRVQKISANGQIFFQLHTFGGSLKDNIPISKKPNTLKGYKVQTDPLGRIFGAND